MSFLSLNHEHQPAEPPDRSRHAMLIREGAVDTLDVVGMVSEAIRVRALALACAVSTLSVAIPCHRVVRTDAGRSGCRWSVAHMRALLDHEAGQAA